MAVNLIGGTIQLAAGATSVPVPVFESNQYNPVPWDTQALFVARVRDVTTPSDPAYATLDLSIAGEQVAIKLGIPDAPFSVIYCQIIRRNIMNGQVWQLTLNNPGTVAVEVDINIIFYHAGEAGMEAQPEFYV